MMFMHFREVRWENSLENTWYTPSSMDFGLFVDFKLIYRNMSAREPTRPYLKTSLFEEQVTNIHALEAQVEPALHAVSLKVFKRAFTE